MVTKTTYRNRIVGQGEEAPDQLLANPRNWRIHPKAQQDALDGVLDKVGWVQQVVVNQRTGYVVDGHLRVAMAISRQEPAIPVLYVDLSEEEEALVLATLDPIGAMAAADREQLGALLESLRGDGVDDLLAQIAQQQGIGVTNPETELHPSLADRFVVPPFSVLDARQGYWQERKRQWLALGIQSELGREVGITYGLSDAMIDPTLNHYRKAKRGANPVTGQAAGDTRSLNAASAARGDGKGRPLGRVFAQDLMRGEYVVGRKTINIQAWVREKMAQGDIKDGLAVNLSGTSIFDPVLCELVYRWFSPSGGSVLDPFAGGSVRGITASVLGRTYIAVDLSEQQLEANREQAIEIVPDLLPAWVCGDAKDIAALAPGEYDLIFSCPPYADLERYSDDPRDLSTMPYADFLAAYREIVGTCMAMLKPDRFACFVVGDIRDKAGRYRNFVSHTIEAFQDAGAALYNEAILVQAIGSLPIRVGKQFSVGRKLGKVHQNVLVFVKGDPRKATDACGPIEVIVPAEENGLVR